tara:strand:+ start:67 stop:321 length:255 start_codon:yes stop_codon:yes gene_type:complete
MNEFKKLIKEKTQVSFYEDGDFKKEPIQCIVIDYAINDFYFYNKNEPIYVTLNLSPIITEKEVWKEYWCTDTFSDIPLEFILLN